MRTISLLFSHPEAGGPGSDTNRGAERRYSVI